MNAVDVLAVSAATGGVLLGLAPALQIRKIVQRRSSEGVSLGYWVVLLASMSVWLAYGVALRNAAMMVTNTVAVTVGIAMLIVGWIFRVRPPAAAADGQPAEVPAHKVAEPV